MGGDISLDGKVLPIQVCMPCDIHVIACIHHFFSLVENLQLFHLASRRQKLSMRVQGPVSFRLIWLFFIYYYDFRDSLSTAAKRLAMHIVAAKPKYMTVTDIPSSVVEAETAVMRYFNLSLFQQSVILVPFREQTMANPPKNASMIDKIVDSKVQKRLSEVCLTGQVNNNTDSCNISINI